MILGLESGSARRGVDYPLLLKSDLEGQMLWMSSRARVALGEEASGLLRVQTRFVNHFFRLQRAERSLFSLAQETRTPDGITAVRQIELERERLGRDLHTGVGQLLVAIRLQVEVITTHLPDPPVLVQNALGRIVTLALDAGEQVRALSRRLHPPEWQRLTLEAAVRQLWDNSGVPERFAASLRIEALPREPEQEIKVLVYRTAQEALANLARHARASRVEMALEARSDRVVLTIQDNGVGFDVARFFGAPANVASGIGLRSIREQAAALGGKLEIVSGPGGTRLELGVPLAPQQS